MALTSKFNQALSVYKNKNMLCITFTPNMYYCQAQLFVLKFAGMGGNLIPLSALWDSNILYPLVKNDSVSKAKQEKKRTGRSEIFVFSV